ncbi:Uncharacterised protein [Mycobacteroides abscessus subsp. abscessus]|nr:Uncharacterised protein [Mycobacteroides abscessus subsp. abscessus]
MRRLYEMKINFTQLVKTFDPNVIFNIQIGFIEWYGLFPIGINVTKHCTFFGNDGGIFSESDQCQLVKLGQIRKI